MPVAIEKMTSAHPAWLEQEPGVRKPEGYFEQCFTAQDSGELIFLVACDREQYCGHVKLMWRSGYPFFRDKWIPDIQDLHFAPYHRRQGIATRLMDRAEALASERSMSVGISVGLHPGYNAAQRMYGARGYVPDGMGVTYEDDYVSEGQMVKMDDELQLHLVKILPHTI